MTKSTLHVLDYDDHRAMAVLSRLDPVDQQEANVGRGQSVSHLALFADWRAINAARLLSVVLCHGNSPDMATPFAVLGLSNTGQAGVAQAAFLARDHERFKSPILSALRRIRRELPGFCAELGIHRIEARSWAEHPRAPFFLRGCGFRYETDLRGYGADGRDTFQLFAWTSPQIDQET